VRQAIRGNLTAPPGAIIGRGQLLESVTDHVRSNRLVVLTGVGGVGKTRLAMEVGSAVAPE